MVTSSSLSFLTYTSIIFFFLTIHYIYRNILLFPRGNNQHDQLSAYLEFADLKDETKDPNKVYACAQFIIVASPPSEPTLTVSQSM